MESVLNIVSRTIRSQYAGGAVKVVKNLLTGLDLLGQSYVLNKALDSCRYLWIHDDYRALLSLRDLPKDIRVVLGPNLFVMPRDIPRKAYIPPGAVYLHPSAWAVEAWRRVGFDACPLDAWPVGVEVPPLNGGRRADRRGVLLYYKSRPSAGLQRIEDVLRRANIEYTLVTYGFYRQEDYLAALERSRYVIWYGRHESQGLALQEALASDRPMIVIDVETVGDADPILPEYRFAKEECDTPATAAPYFDERCGIIVRSIDDLPDALATMEAKLETYQPRAFIEENLGLEICARKFLYLYTKWWGAPPPPESEVGELPPFRPRIDWVTIPLGRRIRSVVDRFRL